MGLKNNIKHIAIISLSFFYCSYIYMIQATRLREIADSESAGMVAVVFGSFSMAAGIFLFALFYKISKGRLTKNYFYFFSIVSFLSFLISIFVNNSVIISLCLCLSCLLSTAGFGAGYIFLALALNVKKAYHGRVFGFGYAIGALITFFARNLMDGEELKAVSLIVAFAAVLISMLLLRNSKEIQESENDYKETNLKRYFIYLSLMVIFAAVLTALAQDFIGFYSLESSKAWFGDSRIYYSIGLVIAGLVYDAKKEIFLICLPVSFIGQLLALLLLNFNVSILAVSAVSYIFLGFFSLFRVAGFINIGLRKRSLLYMVAFGLMYERIVEGIIGLTEKTILTNIFTVSILAVVLLAAIMWIYMFLYIKQASSTGKEEKDMLKEISIKYNLSGQEEKVLGYLLEDLTKKEIAEKMVLSVNTIKVHVTNIYKKTGLGKSELKEIYYKKGI